MKVHQLRYLFGFRPAPRSYGYQVTTFDLPRDGRIEYAQWQHPGETPKIIRQETVDELRRFVRAGDVVLDIGAHTGDSTLPLALAAGPEGVVLALEPNSYVYPVLQKNAQLNTGKTTIVPLNFAATLEPGEYEFKYSDSGFCNGGLLAGFSTWRHGHAFALKVRGENLQEYLRMHFAKLIDRIRFVKVDAEGYDYQILMSLDDLIARRRPFLRVEIHKLTSRPQREQMFDFLTRQGYEIFRIESDAKYRGTRLARRDVSAVRHYDVFCEPGLG